MLSDVKVSWRLVRTEPLDKAQRQSKAALSVTGLVRSVAVAIDLDASAQVMEGEIG